MIKRILIATDFSELSNTAMYRAVTLAKQNNAQLIILHVLKKGLLEQFNRIFPVAGQVLKTPKEEAEFILTKVAQQLEKKHHKITAQLINAKDVAKSIIHFTKKNNIDLLVIGSHSAHSFHDWFVGTTAEFVVRKTVCPVLVIKKRSNKTYNKILVPLDFSLASKKAALFSAHLFKRTSYKLLYVEDHEYDNLLTNKASSLLDTSKNTLINKNKKLLRYIMSEHTKKHPIKAHSSALHITYQDRTYLIPKKIVEKYAIEVKNVKKRQNEFLSVQSLFDRLDAKFTKAGALLKGLRIREGLSQIEFAKKINVTQANLSNMENGKRPIGKIVAKRIEKVFGTSYRYFLE